MQIVANQFMTAKQADLHKSMEHFDLRMTESVGKHPHPNRLVLPSEREIPTIPRLFQAFPAPISPRRCSDGRR